MSPHTLTSVHDMRQTSTQRLASLLMDQRVEKWIQARRERGHSWRRISIELHDRTSGQVSVTGEAIRQWAARDEDAA